MGVNGIEAGASLQDDVSKQAQEFVDVKCFDLPLELSVLQKLKYINEQVLKLFLACSPFQLTLRAKTGSIRCFPSVGHEDRSLMKFTAIITLIKHLIQNLESGIYTTKRHLYYQDVELFQKDQSECNQLLDLLAHSLKASITQLNIYPNQKGMMFALGFDDAILIPIKYQSVIEKIHPHIRSVVIVEKDAIFRSLVSCIKTQGQEKHKGILFVTGKGFPDLLTKSFIWHLACSGLPIYGFMDSDIYGILIFKSYREFNKGVATERFTFLGCFILEYQHGFMAINSRDVSLGVSTLKKFASVEDQEALKWKREIQRGLYLHKKAEMNVISEKIQSDYSTLHYILAKIDSEILQLQWQ
ncbi:DNA topoisomerase IV, alpha subunit [Yamadazyma tenuis ATCC 10573]|uniref:DNA topoisomerase (ATP-hydrolyzing) n=1 Tax=Candida tenuis (strain ATCC 10573 / BCRC 21748 / CBS 615 / JCM 9827 / NBRC 10315 / NRRL Y-1498 / VKM Y-70) TaxID=590646 RepID=G3B1W2_CANTC|nr:DNA topoisomerase IV, alpha subunit [Yamadazyma tenuis ATCC 10573]EGV64541.1 DNA topoisomerase IV, alpha subunit [Yamadazyma tenuis ATCC 10573]